MRRERDAWRMWAFESGLTLVLLLVLFEIFNLDAAFSIPSAPAEESPPPSCCVSSINARKPAKGDELTSTPGRPAETFSFHSFSRRYCLILASLRAAGSEGVYLDEDEEEDGSEGYVKPGGVENE